MIRQYPILSPVEFCVNLSDGECSQDRSEVPVRKISIKSVDSNSQGSLNTITVEATGTVFNKRELRHCTIEWYRNGQYISPSASTTLSPLKKNQNSLVVSQQVTITNATYEDTGSFEALLMINARPYILENEDCLRYYYFISESIYPRIILAQDYTDKGYYKGEFETKTDY